MHQLAWHPPKNNWLLDGVIQKPSSILQRWNSQLVLPWSTRGMDKYGLSKWNRRFNQGVLSQKNAKTGGLSIAKPWTGEQQPAPLILLRQVYIISFLRLYQLPHMEFSPSIGPKKPIESAACVHAHLEAGFPITQHFSSKGDPQQEKTTFQPND